MTIYRTGSPPGWWVSGRTLAAEPRVWGILGHWLSWRVDVDGFQDHRCGAEVAADVHVLGPRNDTLDASGIAPWQCPEVASAWGGDTDRGSVLLQHFTTDGSVRFRCFLVNSDLRYRLYRNRCSLQSEGLAVSRGVMPCPNCISEFITTRVLAEGLSPLVDYAR